MSVDFDRGVRGVKLNEGPEESNDAVIADHSDDTPTTTGAKREKITKRVGK